MFRTWIRIHFFQGGSRIWIRIRMKWILRTAHHDQNLFNTYFIVPTVLSWDNRVGFDLENIFFHTVILNLL